MFLFTSCILLKYVLSVAYNKLLNLEPCINVALMILILLGGYVRKKKPNSDCAVIVDIHVL